MQKPRSEKMHGTIKNLRNVQYDYSIEFDGKKEACLGREPLVSSWRILWARLRNSNFSLGQRGENERF